jgi:hypothetical protein
MYVSHGTTVQETAAYEAHSWVHTDIRNTKRRCAFVARSPALPGSNRHSAAAKYRSQTSVSRTCQTRSRSTPRPLRSYSAVQWSRNDTIALRRRVLEKALGLVFRGSWLALLGIIDLFFRRKISVVGRPRHRAFVPKACLHFVHVNQRENAGFDITL